MLLCNVYLSNVTNSFLELTQTCFGQYPRFNPEMYRFIVFTGSMNRRASGYT